MNEVLKGEWGYKGWVMSDWGATPSWEFALHGLDQESGVQIDVMQWGAEPFTAPLRAACGRGRLPRERLSDMVRRILRSIYAVGVDAWDDAPAVTWPKHERRARDRPAGHRAAEKRRRAPARDRKPLRIAVIGGYAQFGVVTGTGSSAVIPPGGYAAEMPLGGPGVMGSMRNLFVLPSSPVEELAQLLPGAEIEFDPGMTPGGGGHAGGAGRHGDRVRDPHRGRGLRPRRPRAARGARTR